MVLTTIKTQPLDERFIIAKQLAKAVMFVHSAGFVHKNIHPETVLVLRNEQHDPQTVLTGFKNFRLDVGGPLLQGDDLWDANLYRHPIMQDDIYSLGVCLLENGIAQSLVEYDSAGQPAASPLLSGVVDLSIKDLRKRAFEAKRRLVKLAKEKLPAAMGRKYTETVIPCLTCLDKSDNEFGPKSEFYDENGLLVGVRFIEKVSIFS